MAMNTKEADCGVVEWVKQGILRWYGHVMRMSGNDFVNV